MSTQTWLIKAASLEHPTQLSGSSSYRRVSPLLCSYYCLYKPSSWWVEVPHNPYKFQELPETCLFPHPCKFSLLPESGWFSLQEGMGACLGQKKYFYLNASLPFLGSSVFSLFPLFLLCITISAVLFLGNHLQLPETPVHGVESLAISSTTLLIFETFYPRETAWSQWYTSLVCSARCALYNLWNHYSKWCPWCSYRWYDHLRVFLHCITILR